MGTYLLTSGSSNDQTPLTRIRTTTHQRRRRAAAPLYLGVLAVFLAGAILLVLISAMAPPPQPQTHLLLTNGDGSRGGDGFVVAP